MPNRILRDGILTSERINRLGLSAEVFYRRLMSVVDDYGRFDARPSILRVSCYPLRVDSTTEADISEWLQEAQKAGLIAVYAVDGKPFLQLMDFKQQMRAKKSKYPQPPDGCIADATQMLRTCHAYAHLDGGGDGDGDGDGDEGGKANIKAPPTLEEVVAEGERRQIPREVCERFFNACEERPFTPEGGWTLRSGNAMNMDRWQLSLANYAKAYAENERARQRYHGSSGRPGAKKQPSVWELRQQLEAAEKEAERLANNPGNKTYDAGSFESRLKPEVAAKVKALRARAGEIRQQLAGAKEAA